MSDTENGEEKKPVVIRNTTDLQRLKLEKLMKHPEKAILLPEKPKERGMPVVPDFVRNVMGSSAGAGSGEFHVYRHLRRKEYARQKYMKEKGERERLEQEYHNKLEDHKRKAEQKTAKKRAKRLKKKEKAKNKKTHSKNKPTSETSESEDESDPDQSLNEECEISELDSSTECKADQGLLHNKKCEADKSDTINESKDNQDLNNGDELGSSNESKSDQDVDGECETKNICNPNESEHNSLIGDISPCMEKKIESNVNEDIQNSTVIKDDICEREDSSDKI